MMNQDTEHKRDEDPGPEPRLHRRSTDTGFRGWLRRHAYVISYLLLAAAFAYSINGVRNEGVQRRTEIITATQQVIKDSCNRGNDTRELLRSLITDGQGQLKLYLKDGVLNQVQYDRAIAANANAVKKLADVDCDKAIDRVEAAGVEEG